MQTLRKAHDVENPIKLIVVVGVARLDVLLPTQKDWLGREELGENATDCPDVCNITKTASKR